MSGHRACSEDGEEDILRFDCCDVGEPRERPVNEVEYHCMHRPWESSLCAMPLRQVRWRVVLRAQNFRLGRVLTTPSTNALQHSVMPKRKAIEIDDEHESWLPPHPSHSHPYASASSRAYSTLPATSSTSAAQPPAKRGRKKKPDAPPEEKRAAIFKKKCPKTILERLDRVISQRFFMVDRRRNGDELREEFSVLGSTGNVYTVIIDRTPSCNCPDATKGNHCKHILFIFLKVLQVTQASGYWYQKALLTSELREIFAHAPPSPNALANARIREAYARATGKALARPSSSQEQRKRIPGADDDCPVCYENMHGVKESTLVWCEECGNGLHKECFQQWSATARQKGQQITCVFCRAKWATARNGAGAGSSARTSEGYVNLADVAGVSPQRDTSSYYHGPTRGKRHYGYQEYVDYL